MDLIDIARCLDRKGLSAVPVPRLSVISFYDDDFYENYDVDLLSPRRRLAIAAALAEVGIRLVSGRGFESADGSVNLRIPRLGLLGGDPLRPVREMFSDSGVVGLLTPTQTLLLYLERCRDRLDAQAGDELVGLVREQPANLDRVAQWTRRTEQGVGFRRLRPRLEAAQAAGIELRRRRHVRSRRRR